MPLFPIFPALYIFVNYREQRHYSRMNVIGLPTYQLFASFYLFIFLYFIQSFYSIKDTLFKTFIVLLDSPLPCTLHPSS